MVRRQQGDQSTKCPKKHTSMKKRRQLVEKNGQNRALMKSISLNNQTVTEYTKCNSDSYQDPQIYCSEIILVQCWINYTCKEKTSQKTTFTAYTET